MKTAQTYAGRLELTLQRFRYSLRGRYSHANEQQILRRYIDKILPPAYPRTVVDIGAGNGVRWSNSYALVLEDWNALGIEADSSKHALLARAYRRFPNAKACHALASPENINELLADFGIENEFGVLSLDIDGNDFWVLDKILSRFRPALVVTEINENIPPPLRFVVKYNPGFQLRHHFFGHSISAVEDLCRRHGYGILELEYNNAFLAPAELGSQFFHDAQTAYREGYLNRPDRKTRFASNSDMEALGSLEPEAAMKFVREFFGNDEGNYYLASDEESFLTLLPGLAVTRETES
ncbi:MAG TPA: hypothetical protein VNO50_01785 [Pyrinomonadaceae bacterium]|nr:hypothetical protein [Pyrinomonadaceae bacterium]